MVEIPFFDKIRILLMNQHLYMLMVTARERHGYFKKRETRLGFTLADSQARAHADGYQRIADTHFPMNRWTDPLCRILPIPFSRIRIYRESLMKGPIISLTFLFGYATFDPKTKTIQGGTIIARSQDGAKQGIAMQLGRNWKEFEALSIMTIPARFLYHDDRNQDPLTRFRNKFPNIIKE